MISLTELLGNELLGHTYKEGIQGNTYLSTSELNGKVIGLYFSGHWCPPSRAFTPRLIEAYKRVYEEVKERFEIVFISWDENEKSFLDYYDQMPWKALPFEERSRQELLTNRFQVGGIPCLIILSSSGEILSRNGVQEINTNGFEYIRQWSNVSSFKEEKEEVIIRSILSEIDTKIDRRGMTTWTELLGNELLGHIYKEGIQGNTYLSTSELNGKVIGLYFSGHWCPPSRAFTPRLIEAYKRVYEEVKESFEIVFISWDENEKSFLDYYDQMPWKALPFEERSRQKLLTDRFQVEGIPCLIILSASGEILSRNGVQEINTSGFEYIRQWSNVSSSKHEEQMIIGTTWSQRDIQTVKEEEEEEVIIGSTFSQMDVQISKEEEKINRTRSSNIDVEKRREENVKSVLTMNEKTPLNPSKSRTSLKKKRGLRFYLFLWGIICLGLLLVALLTALIIWKISPSFRKGTIKQDKEVITLKVLFSTDYLWESEDQSKTIKNLVNLTDQIKMKLTGYDIRVVGSSFISSQMLKKSRNLICPNGLNGNILQIELIVSFQCEYQNDLCKLILIEQLKHNFTQFVNETMLIYFNQDRFIKTNIKFCSLIEKIEDEWIEETIPKDGGGGNPSEQIIVPPCAILEAKMKSVLLVGQDGTQIRDSKSWENGSTSVTLYENSVNVISIELDCGEDCDDIYHIEGLIDLNDDGLFNQRENRIHYSSFIQEEKYDQIFHFEISIPTIDGKYTKVGSHRMRIHLLPNEQFQKQCGKSGYLETREYNINVISKPTCQGRNVPTNEFVCSPNIGKISVVLIGGELGTQIRDFPSRNIPINGIERGDRHEITLYGDAIYLLRLQFNCPRKVDSHLLESDCTSAHHSDVYIDHNDDGIFDQAENRVFRRTYLDEDIPLNTFDLQILIPPIDGIMNKQGIHRMEVTLRRSEAYRKQCGKSEQVEKRKYFVNIIQRKTCKELLQLSGKERERDNEPQEEEEQEDFIVQLSAGVDSSSSIHCSPGNLICSPGSGAFSSLKLSGEENTMINDELKRCTSLNNYEDQTELIVKLFDRTVYTITIELHCVQPRNNYQLVENNCDSIHYLGIWIDLNNDGSFDQTKERFVQNYQINGLHDRRDYQFNIFLSSIDSLQGFHRMRIILSRNENHLFPCDNGGYGEARDYTLHIISKPLY